MPTIPKDVGVIRGQGTQSNPSGQTFYPNPQEGNQLLAALLNAIVPSRPSVPPQTPAGDIRPIVVRPTQSLQGGTITGVPEDSSMGPVVPTPKQEPVLDENGQTAIGRLLSRLGVPLATTAIGMANPSLLSGAAGFQSGYTGEIARQDKAVERKKIQEIKSNRTKTKKQPTDLEIRAQAFREVDGMVKQDPAMFATSASPSAEFNRLLEMKIAQIKGSTSGIAPMKKIDTPEGAKERMVTLEAKDGSTIQMSYEEARQKGYVK